ncbi:hypothetical protein M408DRAFT_186587 [Serendipita vermifera MAFF 305830]|uniref:SH3 domain-containing protein n=1 Tax=Serendipita vermifera MAFF 305830 TaxID=933852 RepID=A0A0C2XV75_SERVB|nr:hypothetical protein M408DRAFT_186587 [Serendipita vermifera MAFF 305830]
MSQDKLPEIYTNDVDSVDPTTGLGRTGIPHRVGRDLWVLDEEGIRVKEGDTLEVIYRGNIKTWTAILDEDNALVNSEDLEPLSGSLDTSLLLLESANQESLSNYIPQSNRRLLTLVSHPPRANLANLEPLSLDIVMGQSYMSSPEAPNLASPSRKDDEIRVLPPQVRALVNITAKEKTELSYKKGDIIDVVLRNISDVWQGKLGSQAGTFRLDNSVEPILKERVRALWDYDAASPNDLTFNSGDIIEVCGPSNASNWWIHGWMPNRGFGLFPFNFVEGIEDEFPDDDEGLTLSSSEPTKGKVSTRFRVLKDVVGSEEASLSLKQGDIIDLVEKQTRDKWLGKVRSQTGTFQLDNNIEPIMTDRVMAIFSYNATNPEELSFIEGDCITVVGPSDDSTLWWYGTLKGRVGLFPYNYVDLIPDDQDSDSDDGNEAEAPQTLRALHNFSSKDPAILNFDVNDVIKVIDAGITDEWWTGEINGRVGLFPRTYCEETAEKIEDLSQDFPSAKNDSKVDVHRVAGLPSPKLSTLPEVETPMFELMVSKDSSNGILMKERSEEGNQGSQTRIPDESLFPGSRVRPSQDPHQNPDKKGSKDKEALLKAEWVRARHLWDSDKPKELTLQAGDIIQVLKRPYEHWWKGRLERDGQVGLFPVNFVEAVPPPLPPPKRRSSVLGSNEAVIALRSTLAKLHPLLRHFDTTQDLADNAQIQVSRISLEMAEAEQS